MSQTGKLMPNLDQNSTKLLNLTVLQRIDIFIEEILITVAHVTFYEFNIELNQWSRKDVEGSLFVVKRNSQPRFQFIVMNRRNTGLPELLMHKNRLQEYTQRSAIPLPIYQTFNEGFQHAPKFRSAVLVDGETYKSPNSFSHRKAAEQDVARIALEAISKKIKDEGCPLIHEDTVFCKSILNEFAVKMNLEKPTYTTVQPECFLPVFVSSLVFNGVTYTGDAGRNKKEAEQLAARAVILSILGNSGSGTLLSEIIKSKVKLFAALHRVKDPSYIHTGVLPVGLTAQIPSCKGKEIEVAPGTNQLLLTAASVPLSGQLVHVPVMHPPVHELNLQPYVGSEVITPPIPFVPSVFEQVISPSTGRQRNRKSKKKANKKLRTDAQLPVDVLPLNQAPPCSVAQ